MHVFETKPKQWGNSLGVTIPKAIVETAHLNPHKKIKVFIVGSNTERLVKAFGTLKLKKPTQQVMDEIDEGYD